jgi:hypothetical protein
MGVIAAQRGHADTRMTERRLPRLPASASNLRPRGFAGMATRVNSYDGVISSGRSGSGLPRTAFGGAVMKPVAWLNVIACQGAVSRAMTKGE